MITAPHKLRSHRLRDRILPVMTDQWMTAVDIGSLLGEEFEAVRHHLRAFYASKQIERREENSKHGARKRFYYRRAPDANPA